MPSDKLELRLVKIAPEERIEIDGINFSGISYVYIKINNEEILNDEVYYGSFLYFSELEKSLSAEGEYLIFTSVSGVADDCGWDLITVEHTNELILWKFERDAICYDFSFSKDIYKNEIEKIRYELDKCTGLTLEPVNVIFPELDM